VKAIPFIAVRKNWRDPYSRLFYI